MYEKLGASLFEIPNLQVHFFGSKGRPEPEVDVVFENHFEYNRGVVARIKRALKFTTYGTELKPDILIICCWELLLPGLWIKWRFGSKLVYDVQENYKLNLSLSPTSGLLRLFQGMSIRLSEWLVSKWTDHFLLAEKCYANQLGFLGDNYSILENKSLSPTTSCESREYDFVFTGTLSRGTGLNQLIHWLNSIEIELRVKILAHIPIESEFKLAKAKLDSIPGVSAEL